MLLVALVPLLAAGWVMASAIEAKIRAEALREAGATGALARTVADERGKRLLASAELIAQAPPVRQAVLARDRAALLPLVQTFAQHPGDANVAVVDDRGTVLARSIAPGSYGDNLAGSLKGLQGVLRGQPNYSTESGGLVGLALRGFGPVVVDGRPIGAAIVSQNLDQKFLGALHETIGHQTFALLPDGSTVGTTLDPAVAAAIRQGGQRFVDLVSGSGQEQAIYAWRLVDPDGHPVGYLGIVDPLDELDETQAQLRHTAATAGLLAALSAVVLAGLLARVLISPLGHLARAARLIARGTPQAIPRVGRGDELEDLSTSLATMVAELSEQAGRLAAERERTARIVDTVAEGIFTVNRDGRITFANSAAEQMFGTTRGGLTERSYNDPAWEITTVEGNPFPETASPIAWVLRTGEAAFGVELALKRAGGRRVILSVNAAPLRDAVGGLESVVVSSSDMTERKRAEEALLLAKQAAEEANRHKSEFVANMSHELRTPLNAILGFSELLLDESEADYDRATRAAYLQTIHDSGQHLLRLINDVLDLAKVEAGRMELHPEPLQVAEVVAQALATIEPLAMRKGITLMREAAEAGEVVADEGKLKQVLYNLLSNAVKFTPEGGQVVVSARRLPEAVQLTVADTGIGIAPEDQERIFEAFRQLDSGPDRRYEGTGLGLALTRRLVGLQGGQIWVESAPGQGSRFHVLLPLQHCPPVRVNTGACAEG